jgi:hypothetical protein
MHIKKKHSRLLLLDDYIKKLYFSSCHLEIHLNFQLHSTDPANYRASYSSISKEIVDTKITMRSDGVLIMTGVSTTAAVGVIAKTTMEVLLSMRISEKEGLIK